MFRKVLVANRGEIAARIIRTCRDMGIRTVAVYAEPDRWAQFVSSADESYLLPGTDPRKSYLDIAGILKIARQAGADAIHPGYGFLSETSGFARACRRSKITFIGPNPKAIDRLGNKIEARRLARKLNIPTLPGTDDPLSAENAARIAARIGFPLLVKAAAGGGGKGMRLVRRKGELDRAVREASQEALAAFGDGSLFLERYLARPQHVEVQVLGDQKGNVLHFFERECSIQRRHQKLVEESPCPTLTPDLRRKLTSAAVRLCRAAGYDNAGTVEFLVDQRGFYFLEVNSRLQVEHPVTETVTGQDLVRLQLVAASGHPLPLTQKQIELRGHAIECRILAEDPAAGFAPSLGRIRAFRLPAGPFVRVDTDLSPGAEITVHFDSLLAKLITWGVTREQAARRMRRALEEFHIVGVRTTLPFHRGLLERPEFLEGRVHTRFVEESFRLAEPAADAQFAAMLAAGLEYLRRERRSPRTLADQPVSPWKNIFLHEAGR